MLNQRPGLLEDRRAPLTAESRDIRLLVCLALLPVAASATSAPSEQPAVTSPGVHEDIFFDTYPPLATAGEIINRYLNPLVAELVRRKLRASHTVLQPHTFDLKSEKFLLYVPREQPAVGYGLLVFVPPWPKAQLPGEWRPILDKYGVIFVSAERSGNDQGLIDRRIPLALTALSNVQSRFRIDPTRTLIGGFSGGSRVAMRIALAYPDLFSGAFLNAGSDPIAKAQAHLPARDLFVRFQTNSRVAYVTGDQDPRLSDDSDSIQSMRHWCVANVSDHVDHGNAHETASAAALDWALGMLFPPPRTDSAALSACRAARLGEVAAAIDRAGRALTSGRTEEVRHMLFDIDATYGGLAEPETINLADRCSCGILGNDPAKALH